MPRERPLLPILPVRRDLLPWIAFALGIAALAFGAIRGDMAFLAIGAAATGGALLAWAAGWLLVGPPDSREDSQ